VGSVKVSDLRAGDLVVLRTGSPPIVVVSIRGETLTLLAFNRDGGMCEFELPAWCVGPYAQPKVLA
jgi:hypothetical protein